MVLVNICLTWYGPLEFLNGLVIWYQRESATMTSIFNNQNYAGCALAGVLPFFASIFNNQESTNKKIIAIILTTLIILGIFYELKEWIIRTIYRYIFFNNPIKKKIYFNFYFVNILCLFINNFQI